MKEKTLVSLIIPVYNEETILNISLKTIFEYIEGLVEYNWEVILVNDGSTDNSSAILEEFKIKQTNMLIVHHKTNRNLGSALKSGFAKSKGKYVITYDIDLSYDVTHIGNILDKLLTTAADVVVASPYMKGGKVTAVPANRLFYSRIVNYFMSRASQAHLKTTTCMVRGYKGRFIRSLNLKALDYEINPEIIYKASILRANIIEIPAHLDWSYQNGEKGRVSGIRVIRGIMSGLMACFIFRPHIFFLTIGLIFLAIALYMLTWIGIHTFQVYPDIVVNNGYFDDHLSQAISEVFNHRPQSFLIAGFVLVVSLQFIGIGFLSLQKKRYFEEGFHLSTSILKTLKNHKDL